MEMIKIRKKYVFLFIFKFMFILNAMVTAEVNNENSYALHTTGKIDKLIELFRSASRNPASVKLKCEFNDKFSAQEEKFNISTNEKNNFSSLKQKKIKWTKLDSASFNLLETFDETNRKNNGDFIVKNNLSSSELEIKLDKDEFYSLPGIYLCQSSDAASTTFTKQIAQITQQVSVNEIVKSEESAAQHRLDYSILQLTNNRLLIEIAGIYSTPLIKHENNFMNKVVYTVTNLNTLNPVVRGAIEAPSLSNKSSAKLTRPIYLAIEGLSSSTNYSLSLYLKTTTSQINTFTPILTYTFKTLIYNRTRLQSPFQLFSSKKLINEEELSEQYEESGDDDDDYGDDEDYDESDDYQDNNNRNSFFYENKKVAQCELNSNFVKINYGSYSLKKLITFISNSTFANKTIWTELSSNLNNFDHFFRLSQMDKQSLDYSVYYDCLKQVRKSNLVLLVKPLCLFSVSPTLPEVDETDEFYFSVETAFQLPKESQKSFLVYIASTCVEKKRTAPVTRINLNTLNVLQLASSTTTSSSLLSDEKSQLKNRESYFLPIGKYVDNSSKTTMASINKLKTLNFLNLKPPNLTNCVLINESELQFGMQHSFEESSSHKQQQLQNAKSESFVPAPALFYIVEFEMPSFSNKQRNLGLKSSKQPSTTRNKFYIRKEKDFQLVKVNLSSFNKISTEKPKFVEEEYENDESKTKTFNEELIQIRTSSVSLNTILAKSKKSTKSDYDIEISREDLGEILASEASSVLKQEEEELSEAKALPLSATRTYLYRVRFKVISEEFAQSSNLVELDIECKKMINDTHFSTEPNNNNKNVNNGISSVSLSLSALSALAILFIGCLFCFLLKRKYGLTPEYFINLKNNLITKSNNSPHNNHLSNVLNLKKPNNFSTRHTQQLPLRHSNNSKNNYNLTNANGDLLGSTSLFTSTNSSSTKNHNFNYNYEDIDAIDVEVFENYVIKMHVDGDFGFAQLYEEITNITKNYSYNSDIALLEVNRCKNRYSNILTYDHSRVKLCHDDRDETCGYINANYVDGYQKPNAYIATQGPMPNTFADFWRMIWEKNCSIIVMITNVKEKGRIKCDQYWPEEGSDQYGNIQVTHLHSIVLSFYTKRIFTVKLKNAKKRCSSERLVYQYHFTDWPDHGVPYYIIPVLTFIKKSSRSNPEFGGPIVVHCSAGVGRTGTYIVIDAMMTQIKHKNTVNIHTFLKHIRHQRNYLVQTEEQFIFIYDVILEWIKSGETDLTELNFRPYVDELTRPLNENGVRLIDRQFELITEFKPKEFHVSFANLPCNLDKNRNPRIVPVNNSRVILSKKPGVEGSDYINASYLHGPTRQDEFIVTQYPLDETKNNFWQMVWDNNSNQIVVLNSDETESCGVYWLPVGECMKCDSFTVMLRDENFDMDFVMRDFLLQSIDEDYEFNCRMISACYWPDTCAPIKTVFDLINKVKLFKVHTILNHTNSNDNSHMSPVSNTQISPPIIVHDLCGGFRAATFCALYTFQDLIQIESCVNVYEWAKMYHLKRPEVWSNTNNILFLYEAVECLFEEFKMSNSQQQQTNSKHHLSLNLVNGLLNNANNSSLTFIPCTAKLISSPNSAQTLTLPNISNYSLAQQQPSTPNYHHHHHTRNLSNDAFIGNRLQNFHSQVQKNRKNSDPSIIIPLTSNLPPVLPIRKIDHTISTTPTNATTTPTTTNTTTTTTKSTFIDLPRFFPHFFNNNNNNNNNINPASRRSFVKNLEFNWRMNNNNNETSKKSSNSNNNNRAMRFMSTMKLKSASFRRALFPQSGQSSSGGVKEDKPEIMIGISSASSSATASSASSATTDSSKTAFIKADTPIMINRAPSLTLITASTPINKVTSLSKEKLTHNI